MKTLVTGSAGMIGRNVFEQIRFASLDGCYGADLKDGTDISKPVELGSVMYGMEQVFHLADNTVGIEYSSQHHGEMLTKSALLSLRVLEAARAAGVKEYLLASSSCVYADSAVNIERCTPWFEQEGHDGHPESANAGYGWAKRIAERQARYYASEYGMHIVIARPANIYGPSYNWSNPSPHVIPSLIMQMLSEQARIVVWGSGTQTRTFMHERDAARLLVQLMEHGTSGEAYNLGGSEMSIGDLASLLAQIVGYTGELYFDASKPMGPARKSYWTGKIGLIDSTQFPRIPLRDGLEETVAAARKVFATCI